MKIKLILLLSIISIGSLMGCQKNAPNSSNETNVSTGVSGTTIKVGSLQSINSNAIASREEIIYVAPNGSDSGNGSINNPFRTIERAQARVRSMKSNEPGVIIKFSVVLRGGTYILSDSLVFSSADSGWPGVPVMSCPGSIVTKLGII